MKETNLAIFFHVGKCIAGLATMETLRSGISQPMKLLDMVRLLNGPELWMKDFLDEIEGMEMPDTKAAAITLRRTMTGFFGDLAVTLHRNRSTPAIVDGTIVDSSTLARFNAQLKRQEGSGLSLLIFAESERRPRRLECSTKSSLTLLADVRSERQSSSPSRYAQKVVVQATL